ncbi:hypothetical protein GVAV_003241 [Gurleya vavrai]
MKNTKNDQNDKKNLKNTKKFENNPLMPRATKNSKAITLRNFDNTTKAGIDSINKEKKRGKNKKLYKREDTSNQTKNEILKEKGEDTKNEDVDFKIENKKANDKLNTSNNQHSDTKIYFEEKNEVKDLNKRSIKYEKSDHTEKTKYDTENKSKPTLELKAEKERKNEKIDFKGANDEKKEQEKENTLIKHEDVTKFKEGGIVTEKGIFLKE